MDIYAELAQAVAVYKMPEEARRLVIKSQLLVLCGVTAAGKNTIASHLIENGQYAFIVSHTTRQPRLNRGHMEQSGQDYWFVDEAMMLEMVQAKAFVEVKQIHSKDFYGNSISAISNAVESGRIPVTELDVQGAHELMEQLPGLRPLFVLPPSFEVWMDRLAHRGELPAEEKQRRMDSARLELTAALQDERFALIVNHEFTETIAEITRGVDVSEQAQAERQALARQLLHKL